MAWIDDSNIKVVEVVLDHAQGQSPEEIHGKHLHLTLSQTHAAIAYYYDYQQEVDDLMWEWQKTYEDGYARSENTDWREKVLNRVACGG